METHQYTNNDIDKVAEAIRAGKVIAFPTDTVFGLAVIYDNEMALQRLKEAKGRPETKPIPTMVSSLEQLQMVAELNDTANMLADAFMPGAITLILKKRASVADYVTNGFPTIGIRMPDDAFILSLIEKCGKPLLVTSANLSDQPSGVNDQEVMHQLNGRIDGIVLGEAKGKEASTIVDVSDGSYKILREGPILEEDIITILKNKGGKL